MAEDADMEMQMKAPQPMEGTAKLKFVDANGLALMCFGFSTFMFFAFLCNIDEVSGEKNGFAYMAEMLTWDVPLGLVTAGLVQGLNGDHLGFTSYLFHAAILGTVGHSFESALSQGAAAGPLHVLAFFCYAAVFFNGIFAVMAFRIAKMFGVLYVSVGLMFLLVGLNFEKLMSDGDDPTDRTGDYIAGVGCLLVALQCFYLLVPVMTGWGKIL